MSANSPHMNGIPAINSQDPVQDHSGTDSKSYANPYDVLLQPDIPGFSANVGGAYEGHRTKRFAEQKAELLNPAFKGFKVDEILSSLLDPEKPDFVDERNCIVFWARPTRNILKLASQIQDALKEVMPSIWLMPPQNMHTTVLEVAHSKPLADIMEVENKLASIIPELTKLPTTTHGCTLFRPQISFDAKAVALSFIPYETGPWEKDGEKSVDSINLSFHHLRREICQRIMDHGVPVEARYVWPTAHITLARFVDFPLRTETSERYPNADDDEWSAENVQKFVDTIERLNKKIGDPNNLEGFWRIMGELVCRVGRVWYGGGETFDPSSIKLHSPSRPICQWQDAPGSPPCGVLCYSIKALESHVHDKHMALLPKSPLGFICRWSGCPKLSQPPERQGYSELANLSRHMQDHIDPKLYECSVCQRRFSSHQGLGSHMQRHDSAILYNVVS